jgi:hypothetical protein
MTVKYIAKCIKYKNDLYSLSAIQWLNTVVMRRNCRVESSSTFKLTN